MAPKSAAKYSAEVVLKHVCMLKGQPLPRYKFIHKVGGCLAYVNVMNSQYTGEIGGSSKEARTSAASNALKKIVEEHSCLRKDEVVEEYLGRLDDRKEVQVSEPTLLSKKYSDALTLMRDVKVEVLMKAMRKRKNSAECEKFLSMGNEERSKWLETLG